MRRGGAGLQRRVWDGKMGSVAYLMSMSKADPVSAPVRGQRLPWIEHLRGLAALMVLVQHLLVEQVAGLRSVLTYFNVGSFGVVVFFLISGFVIPYSAFGLKRRAGIAFPIARAFRLYPAYWISLLAAALLFHPALPLVLVNGTMVQRLIGQPDVLGVYWTLEIEIFFYLAMEALLLAGWLRRARLYPGLAVGCALLAAALGGVRYWLGIRAPLAPAAGLAVMFLGTCWFLHRRHGLLTRRAMIGLGATVYGVLCVSFLLGYSRDWGYQERPLPFITAYLLAGGLFFGMQASTLRSATMTFLGRISYPLYLLHVLVIAAGTQWLHDALWVDAGVEFLVVIALATLVHYWVEKPFMRWGKAVLEGVLAR